MKRVTRDIDPDQAQELLERAPRACISFAVEPGPACTPIALIWRNGRYLVGVHEDVVAHLVAGQEIVLLVDEGIHWFDLRAIYIRGAVIPIDPPTDAPAGHRWFELAPDKTVAWDYGQLREALDDA